ncbi:MAG TPA: glycosyltransferase family 4 protein [Patescibacteria group bacterium]
MLKIPFVTWSESTAYEKSWQRWLTLPLVKFLVRSSTATIAAGSRAKQYLLSLGARADSLYIAWYTVDTTTLTDNSKHITSKQKQQLKSKLNIPDTHLVVLYVGQFIERKGLLQLLQVAASLKNDLVSIICVGYGPLQTKMQTYKKTHSLKNLHIQTYVPNQKIHEFYTLSDVFILLSLEETWGLVVNEAMAAGKPVVVSKYAGSSDDLVKGNGYIVDPNNVEDIAGKIRYMATHPQQRKQMGQKSEKIIATFTLAQNCNVVSEIATTYA